MHTDLVVLTRREFLTIAGLATGAFTAERLIPNVLAAEEPKKTVPLVEILDEAYKYEVLIDNLIHPEKVAINPTNNQVYFVQKTGTGGAESVYEIVDGKVKERFPGAGDPWGQIQQTEIAINSRGELFVYSGSFTDEDIAVYDLKTGKPILRINNPFYENGKRRCQYVRSVAASPLDNKFYMSMFTDGPLKSLDVKTGSVTRHTPKNIGWRYNMCFDPSGNLYLGDSFDEYLEKLPMGKDGERFEFKNLHEVVGKHEFNPGHLTYDSTSGKLVLHGSTSIKNQEGRIVSSPDYILSVDSESRKVLPIAVVSSFSYNIEGLDVDKNGNIYFSITTYALPYKKDKGKIIKLSRSRTEPRK